LSITNTEQSVQKIIQNPKIPTENKIRLVAIYALRYSKSPSNSTPVLVDLLATTSNVPKHRLNIINRLLDYHNSLQNVPAAAGGIPDLFQSGSFFSGARDRFSRGLKGVENVYTQHSPRLEMVLQDLIKGRLKDSLFPFVEGGGQTRDKPQDIIVFMVGGTTYEEARVVTQINASTPGIRVVLGGTSIHNSSTFLEEVDCAVESWPKGREGTAAERLRREVGR